MNLVRIKELGVLELYKIWNFYVWILEYIEFWGSWREYWLLVSMVVYRRDVLLGYGKEGFEGREGVRF